MISIYIHGLKNHLENGMANFAKAYNFELAETETSADLCITLDKVSENKLNINRNIKNITIEYCKDSHIFRAIGLILQNISDTEYQSSETVYIDEMCVMLDVSQGSQLPKPETLFKALLIFAAMGINALMIYMEDSYEIEGEAYFGYMRPKYSYEDMKSIDDFAYSLGIEAIPCIQTLGHLSQILRWNAYASVKDTSSTLMVGKTETYTLVRKMLETASKPFRTKRIHIGMDEAWGLGLGNFLIKNGYTDRSEVLSKHLKYVMEITDSLGLKPMMWGDMFFRAILGDTSYYTDQEIEFSKDLIDNIPENLSIVYWDYHDNSDVTRNMLRQIKKFGREIIFAGAVRNNRGFACKHEINTKTANCTLPICKEEGIKTVMATAWGDNCPEGSIFSGMLGFQLFAEHAFSEQVSKEKWYKRFEFCARCNPYAFEDIKYFDEVCGIVEQNTVDNYNVSKYLLWQDPMLGMFDENIKSLDLENHYLNLAKKLYDHSNRNKEYEFFFKFYAKAAETLSKKALLGVKIHNAYKSGENLNRIKKEILEVIENVNELCAVHRDIWFTLCHPIGWEIMDMRYGTLINRLKTTISRIEDYQNGKISKIIELEQPQICYNGDSSIPQELEYLKIVSASNIEYVS